MNLDLSLAPEGEQIAEMIDRHIADNVNTSSPGILGTFDQDTQTCTVQKAVKGKVTVDGEQTLKEHPPITNAPLMYLHAVTKGFAITLPYSEKDPCVLFFSDRSIDNFWERGGVQPPEEGVSCRHHHETDAFAFPAVTPKPNAISDWDGDGIAIRNDSRTSFTLVRDHDITIQTGESNQTTILVKDDGTVTITAPTKVKVDTPLTEFTGDVQIDGSVAVKGTYGTGGGKIETPGLIHSTQNDVKDQVRTMAADRSIYDGHTHSDPQGGNTGTPNQQE